MVQELEIRITSIRARPIVVWCVLWLSHPIDLLSVGRVQQDRLRALRWNQIPYHKWLRSGVLVQGDLALKRLSRAVLNGNAA